MKNIIIALILQVSTAALFAQPTPRKIVVEHFSNTLCSACASRNPGFYNNLNANPEVLHIGFHTSQPYSSCTINQYNKDGNDGRAKYYGIFGSTPRIVVQGVAVPASTSYSQSSIFDPYKGLTSAISISISSSQSTDSLVAMFDINVTENNELGTASVYAALVQDQYDFASPNGEKVHYDVFRHAFLGNNGQSFQVPAEKGNKVTVRAAIALSQLKFGSGKMSIIAIVNNSSKAVEQSATYSLSLTTSVEEAASQEQLKIYPNPVTNILKAILPDKDATNLFTISDLQGKVVMEFSSEDLTKGADVSSLNPGFYFISGNGIRPSTFMKN